MPKNEETTTKFKVDISELKSQFQEAQRVIRVANSEFKAASAGMDDWANSADGLEAKISQLNTVLNAEKTKLGSLEKQYAMVVAEQGETSKGAQELLIKLNNQKAVVANTEKQLNKYETALSEVSKETNKAENNTKDFGDEAKNTGDDLKKAEDSVSTFKIALGNLIADGISKAVDGLKNMVAELGNIEGTYNSFQAKTGATAAEMEKFSEQINELYRDNFGDSLDDVANAMAQVAQSTKETDPSKIKDLTENAITLRDTFEFDIGETMRAVNMLMDQFGISGEEAFNLIIQGAQNGLNKNDDLLDSINEYSVHYKQLGYDADDFFNSLANGTEAGTFSVDKLGDAMKEFGIRIKDGSDSTADALASIGLVAGDSGEEIGKLTDRIDGYKSKISDLENKIKYAKIQQSEFTDKTSELTKMKLEDNIAKWNKELDENRSALSNAEDALQGLQNETKSGKKTAADYFAAFAEGGDTAQDAMDEVLTALFSMEDKVAQDASGVALFGTMWEDLGKDGVKALTNVQGNLTVTKKSMEEIKQIKYDDVMNDLSSLGRQIQMDIFMPLLQSAIPKIREAIGWISENLDALIPIVTGLGAALAVAFAVNKITSFINNIVTLIGSIGALTGATAAQTAAQTALNATNPFGWVALATAAIGGLVGALIYAAGESDRMIEKFAALTEEEQALRDETNNLTSSYENWKKAKDEAISNVTSEFSYYEELAAELTSIVDANGKIKKGYEDRADVITGVLSEALGTEITITDGIIQKYDELKQSIADMIEAKKAEAMLAALENEYTTAIQNRSEALQNYLENQNQLKANTDELNAAKAELNRLTQLGIDGFAEEYGLIGTADGGVAMYKNTIRNLNLQIEGLNKKVEEQTEVTNKSNETYLGYVNTIQNYEGVSAAIVSGDTDAITMSLLKLEKGFIKAENGTRTSLQNQTNNYKTELENLKNAIKNKTPGVTQEQVDQMQKLVNESEAELQKFVPKAEKIALESFGVFTNAAEETKTSAEKAGETVGKAAETGLRSTHPATEGKNFTQGFAKGIGDVDALNELTRASFGVGAKAVQMIQEAINSHSPSRETMKLGEYFTQGFALGIEDEEDSLLKTVTRVAENVMEELKHGLDGDNVFDGLNTNIKKISHSNIGLPSTISSGSNSSSSSNHTTVNFYQTNNSPKALSRLDIYRQTKNILDFSKGV